MRAWNKLDANERRGAGGKSVLMPIPNSELTAHCRYSRPKLIKKRTAMAPGRYYSGREGYSIMWEEGKEKIVCPWAECSMIRRRTKWFIKFNAAAIWRAYLALHPPMQFHGHAEKVRTGPRIRSNTRNEDPFIRNKFESVGQTRHQKHYARRLLQDPTTNGPTAMGKHNTVSI